MAERRMFTKRIVNSAKFIKMPASSRLLYYDLGMNADDEGVVEAFTTMKMTGATEDDLRVLVSKGFVRVLNDELVTYILDWNQNNLIRNDRFHESIYHELLVSLKNNENEPQIVWQPVVNQRLTEVRLGKDSIGKVINDSKESFVPHDEQASSETLFRLPLKEKSRYHNITQEDLDHYKELYPAVDVEQEFRSMLGWLEGNPTRRKTYSGIKTFITKWLNRKQNRLTSPSEIERKQRTEGALFK